MAISYFYLDLNVDIMILFFSFLSKQTKKRFREEVKWGCFVGFKVRFFFMILHSRLSVRE